MNQNQNTLNEYKYQTIFCALSIVLILAIGACLPGFAQDDVAPPDDQSQGADPSLIRLYSTYLANGGPDLPSPPDTELPDVTAYVLADSLPTTVGTWEINQYMIGPELEFSARNDRDTFVFYLPEEQGQFSLGTVWTKDNGDGTVSVVQSIRGILGPGGVGFIRR